MIDTAWGDGKHYDLFIVDDDIAIGDDLEPLRIDGRPSIAQDVAHAIRESQLMLNLIGERNPLSRRGVFQQIEMLVEEDERIIPGTARMTEDADSQRGLLTPWIQAKTYEYQHIGFSL